MRAHFLVAEIELDLALRSEPVACPGLRALALPSNPAANQIAVIGVTTPKAIVVIEESVLDDRSAARKVGENSFDAQVEFWDLRYSR